MYRGVFMENEKKRKNKVIDLRRFIEIENSDKEQNPKSRQNGDYIAVDLSQSELDFDF